MTIMHNEDDEETKVKTINHKKYSENALHPQLMKLGLIDYIGNMKRKTEFLGN